MGIVTADIAVSLDGFAAGPNQSLENPLGERGVERLHTWMFEYADEHVEEIAAITAAGAYVMGRNMFGPIRGDWPDGGDLAAWRGWWGEDPPYHAPVFVLTHYPRDPVVMEGGTTFEFVTDGIHSATDRARAVAGEADVAIAGGAETLNQALWAGIVDELRLHVVPLTLGAGERVFDRVPPLQLELLRSRVTPQVAHLTYRVVR
ncbi:5-amino-6-(5-phosphoribosylamino)uracil reductase [Leifsonia sp. Leaf336]|uniref:dihydrofolate reductase family protein n=1 Tax=Leifsonia sp. Leaf336 TaxID=1736341 RepID=UPI0006FCDCBA|nr:dihydrofolate reductase family protein [Leifsonia sp. Leaf336]KQR54129.1 5-amino-6-(5-phosphoribosylamino)uracil reductase [Leifsonia sp. Leaf336]